MNESAIKIFVFYIYKFYFDSLISNIYICVIIIEKCNPYYRKKSIPLINWYVILIQFMIFTVNNYWSQLQYTFTLHKNLNTNANSSYKKLKNKMQVINTIKNVHEVVWC